jgi:hypothetical protein
LDLRALYVTTSRNFPHHHLLKKQPPSKHNHPCRRISLHLLFSLTIRYAQIAARNSEQTPEEASAPAPLTVVPNESILSDAASYSTGGADDTSSSTSAPGGIHVIPHSELAEINTTDEQVIAEPGPSITIDRPTIHYETHDDDDDDEADPESTANGIKEKLKGHKKFSAKDKEVAVYGSFGTLNLLALGAVGYWSWKRYTGGETAWKVVGIAAGAYVGFVGLEWLSVRYVLT